MKNKVMWLRISYWTGAIGDFVIAFSTAYRIPQSSTLLDPPVALVSNRYMNRLFLAVVEATEEAVYNSLLKATAVTGHGGHSRDALPIDQVIEICRKYKLLSLQDRLPGVSISEQKQETSK